MSVLFTARYDRVPSLELTKILCGLRDAIPAVPFPVTFIAITSVGSEHVSVDGRGKAAVGMPTKKLEPRALMAWLSMAVCGALAVIVNGPHGVSIHFADAAKGKETVRYGNKVIIVAVVSMLIIWHMSLMRGFFLHVTGGRFSL